MKKNILFILFLTLFSLSYSEEKKSYGPSLSSLKVDTWQFPSDHLPIGITYDGIHIVSWNVLNSKNIGKNRKVMASSMIIEEDIPFLETKLTVRDRHVVDLLLKMLKHQTHPRSLIALQECSEPFLLDLQERLPKKYLLLTCREEALIINEEWFTVVDSKAIEGLFPVRTRTFQQVVLERIDTKETIRILNVHLCKNGYYDVSLAKYLKEIFIPKETIIVMGDINCKGAKLGQAIEKAFQPKTSPFSVYSPYPSFFSFYSYRFLYLDHFLVHTTKKKSIEMNTPRQVLLGLDRVFYIQDTRKPVKVYLPENRPFRFDLINSFQEMGGGFRRYLLEAVLHDKLLID
ncbi:MAG: hypothetical protein JSR76_04740 [Verrucomicrobia bacterium]|nr:hypothetical protein [Verrucomicrobiota bacterium]